MQIGPYRFRTLKTMSEFVALRAEWDGLFERSRDRSFYLSYHWHHALLSLSRLPAGRIYLTLARRDDELVGILPCWLVSRQLRVFRLQSLDLVGNIYSPLRGCVVARGEEPSLAAAWLHFLQTEGRDDWDVMTWEGVSTGDAFVQALLAEARGQASIEKDFSSLTSDLSQFRNGDSYFGALSKGLRQTIRTQISRLNREGRFRVLLTDGRHSKVSTVLKHYQEVYEASWKEPEPDPEFHARLGSYLAGEGMLRLFLLYFTHDSSLEPTITSYRSPIGVMVEPPQGWTPAAACYFVVHRRTAYFLKTAYREDFARFSPSTVLFWFATRHLLETDGVTIVDHQKGGEAYKLRWAGRLNEVRYRLRITNSGHCRPLAEAWIERRLLPPFRRLRSALRSLVSTRSANGSKE
jgi:hypothetical protein